jgi:hypothetical protein
VSELAGVGGAAAGLDSAGGEKHINSIFAKLGLTGDDSVDRRVKAVLMFLEDSAIRRGEAPCRA